MSVVKSARMSIAADASAARPRAVGWRGRVGLLVFGLILSLLMIEVVLRVVGPYLSIVNSLTSIATFQTYHPIYGFFHRPGASGWIHTPEYTSYVTINSHG